MDKDIRERVEQKISMLNGQLNRIAMSIKGLRNGIAEMNNTIYELRQQLVVEGLGERWLCIQQDDHGFFVRDNSNPEELCKFHVESQPPNQHRALCGKYALTKGSVG